MKISKNENFENSKNGVFRYKQKSEKTILKNRVAGPQGGGGRRHRNEHGQRIGLHTIRHIALQSAPSSQSHRSITTGEPVIRHTNWFSLRGGAPPALLLSLFDRMSCPLKPLIAMIPLSACKFLTSSVRSPSRSSSCLRCWLLTSTISKT